MTPSALVVLVASALTAAPAPKPPPPRPPPPPPVTLPGTEQRLMPSKNVDGVTYKLYVSLPNDYGQPERATAKYDVVYLLDADYAFAITRNEQVDDVVL